MASRHNREIGQAGEDIACAYLHDQGWTILDRNWRASGLVRGELDVVATEPALDGAQPTLVVCEVKTRSRVSAGIPAEAVTPDKARRLAKLAVAWAASHEVSHGGLRLDLISVLLREGGPARLTHLRGISVEGGR